MDELYNRQLQEKLLAIYKTLLTMGANKEDAEDVVQETAIQFIQYIDGISPNEASAWLYKVAIHKYYDLLKKSRSQHKYLISFRLEDLLELHTPETIVMQQELQQEIVTQLSSLSDKEAQLILLKYSADLSLKDIATLFGTTDKTIKTQLARAKSKLKQRLQEVYNGGKINF
ncbi:sigma-70 family RNA polymerase sigma factor [Metasolibacillus sp.]|uniref:RNA polymerase sigma factor n=1 Tax=Metasolibacillus sp. TaxID=2703680 RepID=UPI0025D15C43|nr:sigma-70 family RNA polymerase sigma factor [Metasolibacillus sp.]MCT6924968.1 sigma-70 family RNA polymerase sigma factor [Metasolibacillus sp.]MCT6942366.1 sigma-70 family RNA polymerase sigma factor [Metasolibacillus sp.]